MPETHLQSLHHSHQVLEALQLQTRRSCQILIAGNDKLRSPSSSLWVWSPFIRSVLGSLRNVEEKVLIVPDFSAEDIKFGLDIIDSEYKEVLRFSSRTKNLLETLGVNLELREDVMDEENANSFEVDTKETGKYFNIGNN